MACQYEEKLTSWLLGDLSPQEQQDVTCHVFTCAACRKETAALRRVLSPLQSALHKDHVLFQAKPALPWTTRLLMSPWVRQAALLMISCSIVCAVMTLYYYQLTQRHAVDGPVTQITFGKMERPLPPLEPLTMISEQEPDLIAKLNIVEELGLANITDVPLPALPGIAWGPQFITLNQLAMWQALDNRAESMHERLMRELPEAHWEPDKGPLRRPKKTRSSRPAYGPTLLASPRHEDSTNTTSGVLQK